jgi:hypothetical protein
MSRTIFDSRQTEHRSNLEVLAKESRTGLNEILESTDQELDYPLRISATFPTPNARLNIRASIVTSADGAEKNHAPVKKQIFDIPDSWINFQDQTVSDALLFDVEWPVSNTVGQFRHVALTLIGSGQIKALFTPEAATEAALQNAGGYFVSGGLPLGYITVECTDVLGYFKSAGATSNVIENEKVFRFGSGAGGGGGEGDANSFTENLKHRLTSSYYEFVTPIVFSIDEQTLTDSATATYDLVDGVYRFDNAAEQFTSVDLFDDDFKDKDYAGYADSRQLEVHVEWLDEASIDANATVALALDGVNFNTVPMTRQNLSTKFTGSLLLPVPALALIQEQASSNTNTELNITSQTTVQKLITLADKYAARQLVIELNKLGNPLGSTIIKICKDNAGNPDEVLYQTSRLNSTLSAGLNIITLSDFKIILPPASYHIVIETDAAYKASFVAGVTSIRVRTQSGDLRYSLSGHIFDLRARVTSSAGNKRLSAIGVFYNESTKPLVTGVQELQKFRFSGNDDVTEFTVTNFLPNPDFLKIYDISTGQTYRYPAFTIDGHKVVFEAGTFLVPNEEIQLIFDQSEGSGFDYSDTNLNLLTSNHLGSTDATTDKSIAGRGILIRNEAGELRELWLDANDNLLITNPKG